MVVGTNGGVEPSSTTKTSTPGSVWPSALAMARCASCGRSCVGITTVAVGPVGSAEDIGAKSRAVIRSPGTVGRWASGDEMQAADLMRLQADAILQAADRLDPAAFRKAVELVANCRGKVVISGSGKSGIIGQKISATLTSIGAPSVSLHPSDALHGGLGIVGQDDVAVLLSNSGETEVLVLLPYLDHRNVPVIAIVGNTRSTLAQRADVVLDAYCEREAGPLNLAPTSSTSVARARRTRRPCR